MVEDLSQQKFRVQDYKRIFNEMQDCYVLADMQGTILLVNPATIRVLGYDHIEDLIGKDVTTAVYAQAKNREKLKEILSRQQSVKGFEIEFKKKDGTVLITECDVRLLFNEDREPFALEGLFRDITARKKTEASLRANVRFLETLDRVDQAIRASNDLEKMLKNAMEKVHEVFDADRTWLLYPCDPDAPSWRVPVEFTKPEFPGAFALNVEMKMTEDAAAAMREVLASNNPISGVLDPGEPQWDPADQYGVRAFMMTAVHPKIGKPWELGLHQCSHARIWTAEDECLFKAIGQRIGDALDSQLMLRDLRESRERLDQAQQVADIGNWDWHIESGKLFWSPQMESMLGLSKGEFDGSYTSFLSCIHPEDRQTVTDAINACVHDGHSYQLEHRIVRPDKTIGWFAATGNVFRNESGKAIRMLGIIQDITDRKQIEEQRRIHIHFLESLDRIEQVIHKSDNLERMLTATLETVFTIFDCDRTWLLHPCDPDVSSFRIPFEYTRPEYPGALELNLEIPMTQTTAQDCRDALDSKEPIMYTLGTAQPVSVEAYEEFKVQSQVFIALHPKVGSPWMFGMHQCSYPRCWTEEEQKLLKEIGHRLTDGLSTMLSFKNLQESQAEIKKHRDHLEELVKERTAELTLTKENAEAANMAKSDFLARMSHEIRTPLNAVTGLTNVVLKSELSLEQRDFLTKVKVASSNLLEVINDILDFSKVEAGQLELADAPFDLEQVLDQIGDVFNNRLAQKDLELIIAVSPQVPKQLKGDQARLTQVLTNLIDNAIKFTHTGEVVIEVTQYHHKPFPPEQIALQIRVKDTGIGIKNEEIPFLFDPFSQVDSSLTRERRGTGLGLAICRRLIELMGGSIGVESTPGKGSVFTLTALLKVQEEQQLRFKTPPSLHGLKTMVVDDSATARQVLRDLLESFTFDVSTFDNGKHAIEELQRASTKVPYKLILLDWKMPGTDGLDTANAIRNLRNLPSPPTIVMVTAYGHELVQKRIDTSVVDSLLLKPVKPSSCFNTIMELFNQEESVVARAAKEDLHNRKLEGRRILVAEDNQLNLDVAVALLEEGGVRVETAANGQIAVEMVNRSWKGYYDAVLMDIQMPVLDGYGAAQQIRRSKSANNTVPIIALTAHALKGEREKCLNSGMVDYIAKPIDERQLWKLLLKWIQPKTDSTDTELSQAVRAEYAPETFNSPPGIDFLAAFMRLRGRQALFERILTNFGNEFGDSCETILQCLDRDDHETALRLAHTLKGAASTIGATALAETSAELETSIQEERQASSQTLERMKRELTTAIEAAHGFLEKAAVGRQGEMDEKHPLLDKSENIEKALYQLQGFLETGNMQAIDTWKQIKWSLQKSEADQMVSKIDQMIDRIDFTGAASVLKYMLGKGDSHGE